MSSAYWFLATLMGLGLIYRTQIRGYPGLCKQSPSTNTYQFHFFVLPMIFMPDPTAPYLCSQLASVTKGLCKPLLQANRFLPTSEETAGCAVPICLPGMHWNMSAIFICFTCFNCIFQTGKGRMWNRRVNKSTKPQLCMINLTSLTSDWISTAENDAS